MTGGDLGRGHERARELAALRADGFLSPEDEAWLADHLDFCDPCAAVAADYDAQHDLFADLRAWAPEPPRDLWARTSAAIEAERVHRAGAARGKDAWELAMPWRRPRWSLAPLAAMVAVVVLVTVNLLNANPTAPGGIGAAPTPIALTATADLQVIVRDKQGNLQVLSRPVDSVCPVGVSNCGAQPTFNVTSVNGVGTATTLQGAISPSGDRMVVVAKDAGGEGVYVIPMRSAATAAPSVSAAAVASSTPAPASSQPVAVGSGETPGAPDSPSPSASGSPDPSSSPAGSATASDAPSASTEPSLSATPSASDDASSAPSLPPSSAPTPLPSVEVTPAPDAAIRIASGVTVVGAPMYAPDGVHVAFAAMRSGGNTGPDVYVWSSGDKRAQAITSDHNSWLAAWTADGILVSRVADGMPATFLLDPSGRHATAIGDPGIWLPALSPDGTAAAWWSGTVKLAADGVTWVPDSGKVVQGAWPAPGSPSSLQVLARGPLADWQVHWSDDGGALALWANVSGKDSGGRLSLYRVDAASKAADLANPMLDAAPANSDFSLRTGRLAWTTPTQGAPQVVEVLAWSGKTIGHLEVPADGSGTVVP